VQAGVIEVLPGVIRHFGQLYIGADSLFVTFINPFCMAPANSIVLYGTPVILRFRPADALEFVNAKKVFQTSSQALCF
jgi:hypothetical protein